MARSIAIVKILLQLQNSVLQDKRKTNILFTQEQAKLFAQFPEQYTELTNCIPLLRLQDTPVVVPVKLQQIAI